jgi:hypothetical protein
VSFLLIEVSLLRLIVGIRAKLAVLPGTGSAPSIRMTLFR